jgi:hypothetical protein
MKGHWIEYTEKQLAWLKKHRKLVISEYHRQFCKRFRRRDVTARHLHALRKRMGWKTGRTGCFEKGIVPHNKGKPFLVAKRNPNCRRNQFKKGGLPPNTKYLGHERVSKDGYIEVSVAETNPHTGFNRRYVLKHRWLWENKNGPVPEGHALKCLDGNRLNTKPANWVPLPRAVLARLNGGRHKKRLAYNEAPDELKPIVMAAAKLAHKAKEVRKAR